VFTARLATDIEVYCKLILILQELKKYMFSFISYQSVYKVLFYKL